MLFFLTHLLFLIFNINIDIPEKINDLPLTKEEKEVFLLNYREPKMIEIPNNDIDKLDVALIISNATLLIIADPLTKCGSGLFFANFFNNQHNNKKKKEEIIRKNKQRKQVAKEIAINKVKDFRKTKIEEIQKENNCTQEKAKNYYYAFNYLNYNKIFADDFVKARELGFSLKKSKEYVDLKYIEKHSEEKA